MTFQNLSPPPGGLSRATALTPDEQRRGFWTAGLGVFLLWNLFTLLGDALGDPRQWGLDGAAVAAFLGLLWPRLRQREPVALALVCGVATALAVPLLPPGLPILLGAVVGAAWGWWGHAPDADAQAQDKLVALQSPISTRPCVM